MEHLQSRASYRHQRNMKLQRERVSNEFKGDTTTDPVAVDALKQTSPFHTHLPFYTEMTMTVVQAIQAAHEKESEEHEVIFTAMHQKGLTEPMPYLNRRESINLLSTVWRCSVQAMITNALEIVSNYWPKTTEIHNVIAIQKLNSFFCIENAGIPGVKLSTLGTC